MLPQHWFDRLERRLHWLAVPGLASFLVGMNAIVWVMTLLRPAFPRLLVLAPWAVRHGQWWRVLTFLFVPPSTGPIWTIFWLILLYTFAAALENEWGDVRFNLYYGIGVIATAAASLVSGYSLSNMTLNTSLFLAFAALYPDFEILVFFVLPMKVRWLAWLTAAGLAWSFLWSGWPARWEVAAGIANYLLFFGGDHWRSLRRRLRAR